MGKKLILFLFLLGSLTQASFAIDSIGLTQDNLPSITQNLAFHSLQDFIDCTDTNLARIQTDSLDLEIKQALKIPQTHAHLLYACSKACNKVLRDNFGNALNPKHIHTIDDILAYEKVCNEQNYYVLYHTTLPRYFAQHLIDTYIHVLYQELIHDNLLLVDNKLILRQPATNQPQEPIDIQRDKRLGYIRDGITYGDNYTPEHQVYLLSCNLTLSGNLYDHSGCSLYYWLTKTVQSSRLSLPLDAILDQYIEIKDALALYKQDLEAAAQKFIDNTQTGVLLQLVFKSSDLLNDCVYSARRGGFKQEVLINNAPVTSMETILSALRHNPSIMNSEIDSLQARTVLTKDKLLNISDPDIYANFEVRAYCLPNDALETFKQDLADIMQQVKQSYKQPATFSNKVKKKFNAITNACFKTTDSIKNTSIFTNTLQKKLISGGLGGLAGKAIPLCIAAIKVVETAIVREIDLATIIDYAINHSNCAAWRQNVLHLSTLFSCIGALAGMAIG